jgi:hypothetical protein
MKPSHEIIIDRQDGSWRYDVIRHDHLRNRVSLGWAAGFDTAVDAMVAGLEVWHASEANDRAQEEADAIEFAEAPALA